MILKKRRETELQPFQSQLPHLEDGTFRICRQAPEVLSFPPVSEELLIAELLLALYQDAVRQEALDLIGMVMVFLHHQIVTRHNDVAVVEYFTFVKARADLSRGISQFHTGLLAVGVLTGESYLHSCHLLEFRVIIIVAFPLRVPIVKVVPVTQGIAAVEVAVKPLHVTEQPQLQVNTLPVNQ